MKTATHPKTTKERHAYFVQSMEQVFADLGGTKVPHSWRDAESNDGVPIFQWQFQTRYGLYTIEAETPPYPHDRTDYWIGCFGRFEKDADPSPLTGVKTNNKWNFHGGQTKDQTIADIDNFTQHVFERLSAILVK